MSSSCGRLAAPLALLLWASAASTAHADICEGEVVLFGCAILEDRTDMQLGTLGICGVQDDGGDGFAGMRYVYRDETGEGLSFPGDPAQSRNALFFHHYFKAGLYHAQVRFENEGQSYRIYYDASAASEEPDTVNGPSAGVQVLKDGKVISDIACGENPAAYFDEIRKGTSCDAENPYGEAACAATAPEYP